MAALVGVVLNPVHTRGRAAVEVLTAAVADRGQPAPLLRLTSPAAPGGPQARELMAAGCRTVVAVGGDGTVREVAHAVAGTGAVLGVLPTGTANLFARNLGLPPDPRARAAIALDGPTRRVDLGLAALGSGGGWGSDLPFLAYAGIGEDAATVADTRPEWKGFLGPLGWTAYFVAGVRHLGSGGQPVTVAYDGGPGVARTAWCVLAGNAGRIPGRVRVFPGARLDDGRLQVLEVSGDRARWPLVALEGVTGRPLPGSGLRRGVAATVEVVPHRPRPVQLDGDVVGTASAARFTVAERVLAVRTRRL